MSNAAEFGANLNAWNDRNERMLERVVDGCFVEITRSVVEGSEITGAPGQPVDTGFLKNSWYPEILSKLHKRIMTSTIYARFIEDGNYTLRSQVGGPHSVKLTVAGFQRILAAVVAREKYA